MVDIGYSADEVKADVAPYNFLEKYPKTTIFINKFGLINNNYNTNNGK